MKNFGEIQMKKAIVCALALAALTTPALADYWVVQDSKTKRCDVVKDKPTTPNMTVLGNTAFKTHNEARDSMKTMKDCTSK
jgi:vancomycin permeability regulator SanA